MTFNDSQKNPPGEFTKRINHLSEKRKEKNQNQKSLKLFYSF